MFEISYIGLTSTEELATSGNNQCRTTILVRCPFRVTSTSPQLAPFSFHIIKCRFESLVDHLVREEILISVMQMQDPKSSSIIPKI